jgi:hypothetical protein
MAAATVVCGIGILLSAVVVSVEAQAGAIGKLVAANKSAEISFLVKVECGRLS